MDKSRFMALFPGEDPVLLARLYGCIEAAWSGRPLVSNEFYTPAVWSRIEAQKGCLPPEAGFYGPLEADRRLFASPLDQADGSIAVLEVKNLYPARPLAHQDYMGALMSLGVRREKFSDLMVVSDCCYIPMLPEIMPYILENLTKVGSSGVSCREVGLEELSVLPRPVRERSLQVASLRLDALVAEIAGISRSQAEALIKSGKVMLNYREVKDRAQDVRTQDVLTIRGSGKFRAGEIKGETRKGRLRLTVEQYL